MRLTLLITLTLFLTACNDNTSSKQASTSSAPKQESVTVQKEVAAPTNTVEQNKSEEKTEVIEEKIAVTEPKPVQKKVVTEPKPVQKPAKPVQAETEQKESAVSGRTVFTRQCASCHGQNAEKSALNNSQIIAGWAPEKIIGALKGYQDGSYGGNMKAIMKGQAGGLDNAEIEAVAEYISTL